MNQLNNKKCNNKLRVSFLSLIFLFAISLTCAAFLQNTTQTQNTNQQLQVETELSGVSDTGTTMYKIPDNVGYVKSKATSIAENSADTATTSSVNGSIDFSKLIEVNGNEIQAVGITGAEVGFDLDLKSNSTGTYLYGGSTWKFSADTWGTHTDQLINGEQVGIVGLGYVEIKKSIDGINYTKLVGMSNYDLKVKGGNLYTHEGDDILNGMYYKISYHYEIYRNYTVTYKDPYTHWIFWPFASETRYKTRTEAKTEYKNIIEEYDYYVVYSDLDAVTFNNLSAKDNLDANAGELTEDELNKLHNAQTILDGGLTTSGFTVNKNAAHATDVFVSYNGGAKFKANNLQTFTNTGKYEIEVVGTLGNTKTQTIYVNTYNNDQIFDAYFGAGFLDGSVRIYDEHSKIPVYEGGNTHYNLSAVNNMLPLYGYIKNITTGVVTNINKNVNGQSGTITEAGQYEAVFVTNALPTEDFESGDNIVIKFNFKVNPVGSAPGPTINKRNLFDVSNEYKLMASMDYNSLYYGLTYTSSGKGDITMMFATYEKAYEFAVAYEQSLVEIINNKLYYYNPDLLGTIKIEYKSNVLLQQAIYKMASLKVQKLYLDGSSVFSVNTLDQELINDINNLRTLQLSSSIKIFAEDQRRALIDTSVLPYLNDRVVYTTEFEDKITEDTMPDGTIVKQVEKVIAKEFVKNTNPFMFLNHDLGIDSYQVVLTDEFGGSYNILYNVSVEEQLAAQNAPSGVYTITEQTIFGHETSYQAIYVAKNSVTTELNLSVFNGTNESNVLTTQANNGQVYTGSRAVLNFANDNLDKYALVKIEKPQTNFAEVVMQIGELNNYELKTTGTYLITLTNRLGYSYSFYITIENLNISISIDANQGISSFNNIVTYFDQTNVELPVSTRYGYTFVNYADDNGNTYINLIDTVSYEQDTTLKAVWSANEHTVSFADEYNTHQNIDLSFDETINLPTPSNMPTEFRFVGWKYNTQIITNNQFTLLEDVNVVLTAVYEQYKTVISFDVNGGVELDKIYVDLNQTITLPTTTLTDFDFVCWTNGGSVIDQTFVNSSIQNITLSAQWILSEVVIKLYGSQSEFFNNVVLKPNQTIVLNAPHVADKNFSHFVDLNTGEIYMQNEVYTVPESREVNLVAAYNTVSVEYGKNAEIDILGFVLMVLGVLGVAGFVMSKMYFKYKGDK